MSVLATAGPMDITEQLGTPAHSTRAIQMDLTACLRLIPPERTRQVSSFRQEGGVQYALYSAEGLPSGLLARLVLLTLCDMARQQQVVEFAQLPLEFAESAGLTKAVDATAVLDQLKRLASARWCASNVSKNGFSLENLAMRWLSRQDGGQFVMDFGVEFCEWSQRCPRPAASAIRKLNTSMAVDIYIWLLERVMPQPSVEFTVKELQGTFGERGKEPTMAWVAQLDSVIRVTGLPVSWDSTLRGLRLETAAEAHANPAEANRKASPLALMDESESPVKTSAP